MDEPTRRARSKPELIVLVRSGPEEAVLGTRKNESVPGGSGDTNGQCTVGFPCPPDSCQGSQDS